MKIVHLLGSYDPSAGGMFEFVSNILAYSNHYVIAPISNEFINADNPRIISVKYYAVPIIIDTAHLS